MKKYRLEIPEMVPSNIAGLIARLNDFIQKGTSILTYDQADKIGVSYDHKIIGTYAVPVYFCDECGKEINSYEYDREMCTSCSEKVIEEAEPEFREATAEEWAKDLLALDQATYTYSEIVTESNKAKLDYILRRACEDSFKEGEKCAEWKHRERQTFEEWCINNHITPKEAHKLKKAWYGRDKSRGF